MKRRILCITILILLLGVSFYTLRSTNVSNALKKIILPELELIAGKKFITQKIYINILPLFIEMKDVKAFGEHGDKILTAERVKGYISLSGLWRKEIIIKRLVIKGPDVYFNKKQIEEIIGSVKKYLSEESDMPFKVVIKSVNIGNGNISFRDETLEILTGGLNADMVLAHTPKFRVSAKDIRVIRKDMPVFSSMLETSFVLKGEDIELKSLKVMSNNSEIKTSGVLGLDKFRGELNTEMDILVESAKNILGLKNRGDGKVIARGLLKINDLKSGIDRIFVDLQLKGEMYLETLMEVLEVKETLAGYMIFEGRLKGFLNDLKGDAVAVIKDGNIFDVRINKLACNVSYKDGNMRFTSGKASLYNGTASVEAMIRLSVVTHYSFKVKAMDVDSKDLFKLIKWDPHIPEGRVSGEIESSGSEFNPHGRFSYKSRPKSGDVLDRIEKIEGEFSMKNDIIHLADMFISTDRSSIVVSGDVNLAKNIINLTGNGTTSDIKDFSSPYFTALSGTVKFQGLVSGTLDDPAVSLRFTSNNMILSRGELRIPDILKTGFFSLHSVSGDLTYSKNLLTVKNFSARSSKEEYRTSGNIHFKKARELFELKHPYYDLNISVKNIDVRNLSDIFQGPLAGGDMNADFRLYGAPEDIKASGVSHVKNLALNGEQTADIAEGKISYSKKEFSFNDLRIKKGVSVLHVDGMVALDKRFTFNATAQQIKTSDVLPDRFKERVLKYKVLQSVVLTDTKIKGEGTFEKPVIEMQSGIRGTGNKLDSIGKGIIQGKLIDRHVNIAVELMDGKVKVKGDVELTNTLSWSVAAEMQPARYDFIVTSFLKDVPEDLLVNLTGSVKAYGDKNHVNAIATIDRVHIHLYGIGFTNSSDIIARLEDRKLSIGALSMKGDATEFKLSGNMTIGKSYDMLLEGSSSLAPLKAISKTIDVVKGNASFVFAISGAWDKPKINGGMDVTNGTLGFKDIHYRLTSISAYIYVDEDRIVVERAMGKLSGGDVNISGTAYLQRFSIKRFFMESRLNNITASVSKDFWVSFDGNLYYRGNMESQTLLGDIAIKNAKYSERVEWKSWLLKARTKERPRVEVTGLDKTNLNIRVSGTNLFIDNNVARALMKMDALLRGSIGQPILLGKVEANEGIVYFRNNEFKVLKASVDFANPNQVNPYFDIAAETRVRNYNIRLYLDGYMEQFNLSLSSSPALDETDIFSLLTVGQMGKHLKGLEGGIGASEATSFLTGKLQDVFEERLKTITGFDRVQIDPYVSKSTGTVTPRLTLSKRLLGDRLYVTYSTSVGTGEEQVWKLEYTVGKNTSLVGIRDERGGLGGNIKFRFEFK